MNPFRYFVGRALQILGLATLTYVVFIFFTPAKMEPLLYWSLAGAAEFYGGSMILGKSQP